MAFPDSWTQFRGEGNFTDSKSQQNSGGESAKKFVALRPFRGTKIASMLGSFMNYLQALQDSAHPPPPAQSLSSATEALEETCRAQKEVVTSVLLSQQ